MNQPTAPKRPANYDKAVGLVLQGGGALGSYQAGVYEALAQSEYLPDWVAGVSIGAINAAIIAGNAPERRVERLRAFWEGITAPAAFWPLGPTGFAAADRAFSVLNAVMLGQPGFFAPRPPVDFLLHRKPVSYYDTAPLRATLERLVDFDRINARGVRLSLGAVNVMTGRLHYFDNARDTIRPEHVMASGALPPGFPAVEINGVPYWDGGVVSNTPLRYVLEQIPRRSRLTFQVDVFHASGPVPESFDQISEREKDIRFSSRTRRETETFSLMHDVRHNINTLWEKLPEDLRNTPEAEFLYNFGCVTTMDIMEIIYRPGVVLGQDKDYEFSAATMRKRWDAGLEDARSALAASPWLQPMPSELGARTFDHWGNRTTDT
jgi:NTE family protein